MRHYICQRLPSHGNQKANTRVCVWVLGHEILHLAASPVEAHDSQISNWD